MKKYLVGLGVAVLMFAGVGSVNATLVSFTATDFADSYGGVPSPLSSISGEFDYFFNNVTGHYELSSIDLTIKNKVYALSDIDYNYSPPGYDYIVFGVQNVSDIPYDGVDDFLLTFYYNSLTIPTFLFTTIEDSGAWRAGSVTTALGGNPVPEPATMLLFGTGLFGLVGSRLRKKKK